MDCKEKDFKIEDHIIIGEQVWNPLNDKNVYNFADRILIMLKHNPDFIGQVDAKTGEKHTYKQMMEKSVTCALWMQQTGIQPNDVITVCSHNQLDACIPLLAALYIGAIINPLDEFLIKGNLTHFLKQTKPKMLFIDNKLLNEATYSQCRFIISNIPIPKIVTFNKTDDYENLETILEDHYNSNSIENFHCPPMTNMTETVIQLFTPSMISSKLVELPRLALYAPSDQLAPCMRAHGIGLWFESLGFINGILMTIQAILSLVTVIKVQLNLDTYWIRNVLDLIIEHNVTWIFLQNDMLTRLIKSGAINEVGISSLETIVYSGSVINPTNYKLIDDLFYIHFIQTYSLTETGIIAYQRPFHNYTHISQNVQIKIVSINPSEKGKPLGPNRNGEIYCYSPYMMIRKNHESNAYDRQFDGNWFKTGDLGFYDKMGHICIVGYKNKIFKHSDNYVLTKFAEFSLQSHPAVSEAIVSLVPTNSPANTSAAAFVIKYHEKKVTAKELAQHVIEKSNINILSYKNIVFLNQLPRMRNGKIYRKLLDHWALNLE